MNIVSKNVLQTRRFARQVAERITASTHRTHAAVLALSGDLGSGKTTFAQGFARALGIRSRIASPTFIIFRRYKIDILVPERNRMTTAKVSLRQAQGIEHCYFYHVDAYRLRDPKELAALGFKKILTDPKNIVLVEWPENVKKLLPKDTLYVALKHGKTPSARAIEVSGGI